MAWQYMKDGEICGPLDDAAFEAARPGISGDTKIYKDGWAAWRALEDVPASEFPKPPEAPALDESAAVPAGFGRRAGALILDYLLIRFLVGQLGLSGQVWQAAGGWQWSWSDTTAWDLLSWHFLFTAAYETLMTAKLGWTLGKFVFGIRVSHEGRPPSPLRALLRVGAKKLNWITLLIGYLMALWDKDKKALHDHLCKTRVFLRS
jgi:uncharacterized RDD family membrane protein YckC